MLRSTIVWACLVLNTGMAVANESEEPLAIPMSRDSGPVATRVLVKTRPVTGIDIVDVHAGTGVVALQGAADQADLLVTVRLSHNEQAPPGASSRPQIDAAIAAATLEADRRGSWLFLEVAYPPGMDPTHVREQWTVSLPPGVDAEVEMAAGRLFARDVDGRLDLHLGVGTIQASTRGPGVDARVSYGDARVDAFSPSPGRLSASTGTGSARVTLDGIALPLRRPLPGAVASGNAGGDHDFVVRSDVGRVVLRVQRVDPPEDSPSPPPSSLSAEDEQQR